MWLCVAVFGWCYYYCKLTDWVAVAVVAATTTTVRYIVIFCFVSSPSRSHMCTLSPIRHRQSHIERNRQTNNKDSTAYRKKPSSVWFACVFDSSDYFEIVVIMIFIHQYYGPACAFSFTQCCVCDGRVYISVVHTISVCFLYTQFFFRSPFLTLIQLYYKLCACRDVRQCELSVGLYGFVFVSNYWRATIVMVNVFYPENRRKVVCLDSFALKKIEGENYERLHNKSHLNSVSR